MFLKNRAYIYFFMIIYLFIYLIQIHKHYMTNIQHNPHKVVCLSWQAWHGCSGCSVILWGNRDCQIYMHHNVFATHRLIYSCIPWLHVCGTNNGVSDFLYNNITLSISSVTSLYWCVMYILPSYIYLIWTHICQVLIYKKQNTEYYASSFYAGEQKHWACESL